MMGKLIVVGCKELFLRGSVKRYVQVPAQMVDTEYFKMSLEENTDRLLTFKRPDGGIRVTR